MKKTPWMLAVLGAFLAAGCTGMKDEQVEHSSTMPSDSRGPVADDDDDGDEGDEQEIEIALSQVPDAVKQAALGAVPGLVLSGAEKETEHGTVVYCLEGTAGGESYEVEVTADGKVVEIEEGDEEGEEDDD